MKIHSNCRCCGSNDMVKYLDLGQMPMSNNLELTKDAISERFPLEVMFCNKCSLSQLSVVIDPEKLFSQYAYRSSISKGYVNHCKNMAVDLQEKYKLTKDSFHVDVAGNDGALLKEFKNQIGLRVLNIDPAKNLCEIAISEGVPSHNAFLNTSVALDVVSAHGSADLVTATNVFAHVDNIKFFLLSCRFMLKRYGVIVLEFPYLVDFIENIEFDTVYFEHLSYMSLGPIMDLCRQTEMKVIDVSKHDIHGGTMRVVIAKKNNEPDDLEANESVQRFLDAEIKGGFNTIDRYLNWSNSVKDVIQDFSKQIKDIKSLGYKVCAFAASAKGNTLLNCSGVAHLIDVIYDDTPEKIGMFSPGTGIPIVHPDNIIEDNPDYLVILSWNFQNEIMERVKDMFHGKFIIPIPEFKVI